MLWLEGRGCRRRVAAVSPWGMGPGPPRALPLLCPERLRRWDAVATTPVRNGGGWAARGGGTCSEYILRESPAAKWLVKDA